MIMNYQEKYQKKLVNLLIYKYLDFMNNKLKGEIPKEIGKLTNLYICV